VLIVLPQIYIHCTFYEYRYVKCLEWQRVIQQCKHANPFKERDNGTEYFLELYCPSSYTEGGRLLLTKTSTCDFCSHMCWRPTYPRDQLLQKNPPNPILYTRGCAGPGKFLKHGEGKSLSWNTHLESSTHVSFTVFVNAASQWECVTGSLTFLSEISAWSSLSSTGKKKELYYSAVHKHLL
jgi:hypothetical protein